MAKTVNLVQRKIFWIMIIILLAGIFLIYLSQQPAIGTIKVLTPSHITEPKNENESTREKERRQFAEKAEKIGNLTITSDLLASVLGLNVPKAKT